MTNNQFPSRRDFLKKSAILTSVATAANFTTPVHAAGSDKLRIGLIGCGGRGRGAVVDAMGCGEANLELVAVCDIFKENATAAVELLKEQIKDRVTVTPETTFDGFDGYKKVIAVSDVVFLCTPQLFRPMMLKAAVEAGKHIFCEKPVAADAAGVRSVLESAALAKQKNLSVVTGLVNRYSTRVREVVERIHGGQIGKPVTARANRMGGPLWTRERKDGDNEMTYQMRNWVNFDWISADYINDVTIHQLDVALWCIGDKLTPVRAFGTGGRLVRTAKDTGDLYDSMAVVYEYEDGRPLYAFSRQIPNSYGSSSAYITGEKGHAEMGNVGGGKVAIYGANPYEAGRATVVANHLQHATLYQSVRGSIPYVNNLPYTAKATMAAILGKMATHSAQLMTWEEAFNAPAIIDPATITWDTVPPTLPDANGFYKTIVPE